MTITSSTTTSRIEQPTIILLLRVAWVVLLVFQLMSIAYLIPVNLSGSALLPQFLETKSDFARILSVGVATLSAMTALLLSTILMWRSHNERAAMIFSLVFLAFIPYGYTLQVVEVVPTIVAKGHDLFATLAFLAIIYLFPDVRFVSRWARYLFMGVAVVVIASYLPSTSSIGTANAAFFLGWIIGAGTFVYRYRRAIPVQRQQIKWLLFPFLGGGLLILTWASAYFLLPDNIYPVAANLLGLVVQLLILSIPVAVGFAILRYGLWQVDLVINRALVYSGLLLIQIFIFMVFIGLASAVFGSQGVLVGLAFGAGAAIGLFQPTRRQIQHLVDLRMFHLRFDLNEVAKAQKKPDISNPGAFTGKRFGSYEALGVLGRGGMGEVYKGFGSNETVAIKILPHDLARQEEFRKRFEREAQLLGALNHPNIVQVKDSGISDDTYYLAMEFIDGRELSMVIGQGAQTDYDELRDWLRDIASALDDVHAKNMVHRDLKPSNIMLRNPLPTPSLNSGRSDKELFQAVLMDFGIARSANTGTRLTGTGAVGTIDYMAPEQIMAARDVDKRADIYALGVIVYELLTGERPFKGSAGQVLFAHLQQPAPNPCDLNANVPRHMAKAVQKALAKDPDERFQSAGEFALAL